MAYAETIHGNTVYEVEFLNFDKALSEIISPRCVSLHHNFLSHFLLLFMHFEIIVSDNNIIL